MDTAKFKTPDDFIGPPTSPKRRRHTSIACECCRKLKVRCLGGEAAAIGSSASLPKPCNHCISQSKTCIWPEEDGRKKAKTSSPATSDISFRQGTRGTGVPGGQHAIPPVPRLDSGQTQDSKTPGSYGISPTSNPPPLAGNPQGNHISGGRSDSDASQTPYTLIHTFLALFEIKMHFMGDDGFVPA